VRVTTPGYAYFKGFTPPAEFPAYGCWEEIRDCQPAIISSREFPGVPAASAASGHRAGSCILFYPEKISVDYLTFTVLAGVTVEQTKPVAGPAVIIIVENIPAYVEGSQFTTEVSCLAGPVAIRVHTLPFSNRIGYTSRGEIAVSRCPAPAHIPETLPVIAVILRGAHFPARTAICFICTEVNALAVAGMAVAGITMGIGTITIVAVKWWLAHADISRYCRLLGNGFPEDAGEQAAEYIGIAVRCTDGGDRVQEPVQDCHVRDDQG
jgi:hypothetical protein